MPHVPWVPPFVFGSVTPRLLAGREPRTAAHVAALRQQGVTHVLDLRQPEEWTGPGRLGAEALPSLEENSITRLNVPVEDGGAPTPAAFDRAVAFIQDAFLQRGTRVYVHCRAGIERTGAVLVAWWAWEHGAAAAESLDAIQRTKPDTAPLGHQLRAARDWLHSPRPGRTSSRRSRLRGCVLGGAAGDALGAPVEFSSLADIRARYGPGGIRRYAPAFGQPVAITDDTQMTLFTIEGLVRASVRGRSKGVCHPPSVVKLAYWRWLTTQGEFPKETESSPSEGQKPAWTDGWLLQQTVLHARRAPGHSCLSALRSGRFGRPEDPINDSKGCGAVMRGAPVGFVTCANSEQMFALGCEIGALTHGHPTGYSAAGALAVIVERLREGETLEAGVRTAIECLARDERFAETRRALESARGLAGQGDAAAGTVESLGGGWVAEEALAIAVYAALAAPNFEEALVLAVNHGGDSDSTGAICGNLLGARDGVFAIPPTLLRDLEAREIMVQLADDFALESTAPPSDDGCGGATDAWLERYPGW